MHASCSSMAICTSDFHTKHWCLHMFVFQPSVMDGAHVKLRRQFTDAWVDTVQTGRHSDNLAHQE